MLALVFVATLGACDARPEGSAPAAETKPTSEEGGAPTKSSGEKKQGAPKGTTFSISAGSLTVRRVGFDTLRIVGSTANTGWRRRKDDDFDDSVGIDLFKGRQSIDLDVSLDNGRMRAEACQDLPGLGSRPAVGQAGAVSITRIGDEDLHVSIERSSPGWRARITDNNSEDVEVLFVSKEGRIEFDADLDDGRLEGRLCRVLR